MSSETTPKENGSAVSKEAAQEPIKIEPRPATVKAGKTEIQLHQPTAMIQNRPIMPSDVEVVETLTVAGVRPIAASHMALVGSFLNGRPISASSIKVLDTLPGDRPIFASEIKMVEGTMLPGDRPIMVSDPHLLQASLLPGNRPIASNDIDDPESLMGFID